MEKFFHQRKDLFLIIADVGTQCTVAECLQFCDDAVDQCRRENAFGFVDGTLGSQTIRGSGTTVGQHAQSFEDALDKDNLDDQRYFLQELIKKIELDGDDVHIHWNFV